MYIVLIGDTEVELESRADAIRYARTESRADHRSVHIRHSRGFEQMLYRRGRLEEGAFTTRDRRRAR